LPVPPAPGLVALAGQLLGDEFPKALEVLAVEFNVIVPGPIHPQRLHGLGAAFEEREAVGEVDDFVLCAVDDEDGRGDFGDLLNAAEKASGGERREGSKYRDQGTPIPPAPPEHIPSGKGTRKCSLMRAEHGDMELLPRMCSRKSFPCSVTDEDQRAVTTAPWDPGRADGNHSRTA